jgi:hypothetical protein
MSKELRSGISCNGDIASIAVLEINGEAIELKHLEELRKTRPDRLWFFDILDTVDKKTLSKLAALSVAVETENAILHKFPMDSSLTQVEMNEQVGWELSNYIADFHAKDYISDLKIMQTNAREQVADVLAIVMEKSFVFGMHEYLKNRKVNTGAIDIEYFAAEEALLQSHPETKDRQCAIVRISRDRVDAGVLSNSRLLDYRHKSADPPDSVIVFLQQLVDEFEVATLYVHGLGVSFEWQKILRREFKQKFMLLNPFRRMRISPSVPHFGSYNGNEFRFACAVGGALWRER